MKYVLQLSRAFFDANSRFIGGYALVQRGLSEKKSLAYRQVA